MISVKKFKFFLIIFFLLFSRVDAEKKLIPVAQHEHTFAFNAPTDHKAIDCLMLFLGNDEIVEKLSKIIQFDLEFSDQLKIDLKRSAVEPTAEQLSKLYNRGVTLYFYIKKIEAAHVLNKDVDHIEVTVKDPSSSEIIFQKTFAVSHENIVFNAHVISDSLMPVLTGSRGPLLSTLAYCKQVAPGHKVVCISDVAGRKERVIVGDKKVCVAPRWHTKVPMLFFSQFTRTNCELSAIDILSRKRRVISSYDGFNMQPSFSNDGDKVVLCFSSKGNSELYLYDQRLCQKLKRRAYRPLTNNGANNVSPCLTNRGSVVFCSDFQTGAPQIYELDIESKKVRRLTSGSGYCSSPSWCERNSAVVYTRRVNGTLQLFTIDANDHMANERQLTFNEGDKIEPTWSSCGNYVVFAFLCRENEESSNVTQIAVLNVMSGKIRVITSGSHPKGYPAWVNSPLYHL